MTAVELGRMIREGETTSVEATERLLKSIRSDEHNAYISVCENALDCAEQTDKLIRSGQLKGPLAGVPVSVKDNICTKGIRTTCASRMLENFTPVYSATAVERLENAGAVIVGKLNMDEFAMGSTNETSYFGPVTNPWDTKRVPGGSSGGSAAAVSAGSAVCALGSDTGGSIRQPSAFCGVTGIKPTYGAVSRYGLVAFASSLDQIGAIAHDAKDCAAILDIIGGWDERDPTTIKMGGTEYLTNLSADIKGMKIGMLEECFGAGLDPEVEQAAIAAAQTLKSLGAEIEYFNMPVIKYATPAYYLIACAEASSNLSRFDGVKYGYRSDDTSDLHSLYSNSRSEGFGDEVKRRILLGTFVLSAGYYDAYYRKAMRVRALIKQAYDRAFEKYDIVLYPTTPGTAGIIGGSDDPLKVYQADINTSSVNLAGLPALSMPCGFSAEGLPIGVQLIGRVLGEQSILNAAHAYQCATDFHKEAPV